MLEIAAAAEQTQGQCVVQACKRSVHCWSVFQLLWLQYTNNMPFKTPSHVHIVAGHRHSSGHNSCCGKAAAGALLCVWKNSIF